MREELAGGDGIGQDVRRCHLPTDFKDGKLQSPLRMTVIDVVTVSGTQRERHEVTAKGPNATE